LPLNNEVTSINYGLSIDANTVVSIYDPDGELFTSFHVDKENADNIIWGGQKMPVTNNYIFQNGTYIIEVRLEGMREKKETTLSVLR